MAQTSEADLRRMILIALGSLPTGSARRADVLDRMEALFGESFTEEDRAVRESRAPEPIWRNVASFGRDHLKTHGLLELPDPNQPGYWTLSDLGWEAAAALLAGADIDAPEDPAQPVARRIASEFNTTTTMWTNGALGRVAARREAELTTAFDGWLRSRGHQADRWAIKASGMRWPILSDLSDFTARTLYEAKATISRDAVRLAVGQVLDYSRFLPDGWSRAVLLPKNPGRDLVDLCSRNDIDVVFRAGGTFIGPERAIS